LLRSDIPTVEIDAHIDEPGFAEAAVLALDELMHAHRLQESHKHSRGIRKESEDV